MSAAVVSICLLLYHGQHLMSPRSICRCEPSTRSVATCGPNHANSWQWGPQGRQCGAARLNTLQARYVLQQKWIVMAGDSITRFLFAALLRLLADDGKITKLECLHRGPLYTRCQSEQHDIVFVSCPKESAQQLLHSLQTRCICKQAVEHQIFPCRAGE
jgi:hypothetical protein